MANFLLPDYRLQTEQALSPVVIKGRGSAYTVDQNSFPVLQGITSYVLEVWEECMRLPHWHPNASELGYVVSGAIEVIIWRSPGETAVFTVTAGMCWFIPQSALHSLNNVGDKPAQLLVSFSDELPQDMDLPVAFNGIPLPIRDAYTTPHSELRAWTGVVNNPLLGKFTPLAELQRITTGSPYAFDLAKVTPLFNSADLGSVIWAVKSNWAILQDLSLLRAHLKPGVARDAIWYPDAGTLYVVSQGKAEFHLVIAGQTTEPLNVQRHDYIFVPTGVLHTFINTSQEDFEVIAFFTKADPQPEVSLGVAANFFPHSILKEAMTEFGTENKEGNPLKDLHFKTTSPYLLKVK
ncbi:MAG TPA: cupin domain-containing protein [Coxiellaceae bacterium]|nr:cupin domain-containing protein [Coxiellaceae bacterium]